MPNYKHGKQEEIIPFNKIVELVENAKLKQIEEAYFWLLYYLGLRKSEGYEMTVNQFKITKEYLTVDVGQRKKGSARTDPLDIPIKWNGINKIVEAVKLASRRKARWKRIYRSEPIGKTRTTTKGNVVPIKKRVGKRKQAKWVFPHIQKDRAWKIVKHVLGEAYYPHFLRLLRLTELGSDPTASLTRLKSFSGIRSITSLQKYLGTSKKEQKKALEFMEEMQKR